MGAYRVFKLDFVSHGQSNVEKTSKQITCSYKSIKLDIHATSQTYRVTLARTTLEPVGPQVVQQEAVYRQWLPHDTPKRPFFSKNKG